MTDHNREELIEEAAATIAVAELVSSHRTWGDLLEPQKDEYRRLAAQVLTVFEQAHTPTSDERERKIARLEADLGIEIDRFERLHENALEYAEAHPRAAEPQAEPTVEQGDAS